MSFPQLFRDPRACFSQTGQCSNPLAAVIEHVFFLELNKILQTLLMEVAHSTCTRSWAPLPPLRVGGRSEIGRSLLPEVGVSSCVPTSIGGTWNLVGHQGEQMHFCRNLSKYVAGCEIVFKARGARYAARVALHY